MQEPGIGGLVPPLLKCNLKMEVNGKNRKSKNLLSTPAAKPRLDQNVSPTSVLKFPESPVILVTNGNISTSIMSFHVSSNAIHDLVTGVGPTHGNLEDRTDNFGSLQKIMETKPPSVCPSIIEKSSCDVKDTKD